MFHLLIAVIYLAFISLGLPDGLLGAAWPSMYPQLGVEVSSSGLVYMIISLGTVVSSLLSDRVTRRFGAGRVTAFSVALTAAALLGFSVSKSYIFLCLWAVPYGLGAGSVDASLNNYVALHYESKHMSWLHCMWGVGASVGPYIMGAVLERDRPWNMGYLLVGVLQVVLVAVLLCSLPLWKSAPVEEEKRDKALSLREIFAIPGAKQILLAFFCYCALEQTAGLWSASYLVLQRGLTPEAAASFAAMFYLGITLGRFINGFIAMKLSDHAMIVMGLGITALGIGLFFLPGSAVFALVGLCVVGLGCAPVYPCIIHSTPEHFGAENSQALVGVQMASAYLGNTLMPPLFGIIAGQFGAEWFPVFLAVIFAGMAGMYRAMRRKTGKA